MMDKYPTPWPGDREPQFTLMVTHQNPLADEEPEPVEPRAASNRRHGCAMECCLQEVEGEGESCWPFRKHVAIGVAERTGTRDNAVAQGMEAEQVADSREWPFLVARWGLGKQLGLPNGLATWLVVGFWVLIVWFMPFDQKHWLMAATSQAVRLARDRALVSGRDEIQWEQLGRIRYHVQQREMEAALGQAEKKFFAAAAAWFAGRQGSERSEVVVARVALGLPPLVASLGDSPLGKARPQTILGTSFLNLSLAKKIKRPYQRAGEFFKARCHLGRPKTSKNKDGWSASDTCQDQDDASLASLEETLQWSKANLGPDHPKTIDAMADLAYRYYKLGRYQEAIKLYQETIQVQKANPGPQNPYTLGSMHNLGLSYYALGRYHDALEAQEETMQLMKTALGSDHLITLINMVNLANTYHHLGQHDEALRLREETVRLMKEKLGPDHPHTLTSMNNLATSYRNVGRYQESLALNEETLRLRQATLGPDHRDTLQSMGNLANSYYDLGRHEEALELREETVRLMKEKLGPDHPGTLQNMNNLSNSYDAMGWHDMALALREETLALREKKLGPDHPDTLQSMSNLSNSYYDLGRHEEALELHEKTLRLMIEKLDVDHPRTLVTMYNLANRYADLGRHDKALELYQETLRVREAAFGLDHPATLLSMSGVARTLVRLDRSAEAVPLIDECLRRAVGESVDAQTIHELINDRLRHFQKAGDVAGCRETVQMWEQLDRRDAKSLYLAASLHAVTAAVIRATDHSDEGRQAADVEADRAMERLAQAVAAGFNDAAKLDGDEDLALLRDREDFQKLRAKLDRRPAPVPDY